MSTLKKFATAVIAAGAMTAMTPASAIIVGGIDFGALGNTSHIETATIAATFANAAGQSVQSYGQISVINGDATYCADGSANCTLYYTTAATVSAAPAGQLYLSGTVIKLFYSNVAAVSLFGQDSLANLAFINALPVWASLKGENGVDFTAAGLAADTVIAQSISGLNILTATGAGLISVNTSDGFGIAAVEAYLNSNTIVTANFTTADIAFTESGDNRVLNPFDKAGPLADSCQLTPVQGGPPLLPTPGDWCIQGSADLRGDTVVPEPGSVALLGLGLLALGASRRVFKK